jgi:fatty acid desaturase
MYVKSFISFFTWISFYLIAMYAFESFWLTSIFAILCGWSVANVGMFIMHDGNHGGFSNSPLLNRIAGGAFDMLGGSSYCWKMIHSVGHHCYTNVEELDPDIRKFFFCFNIRHPRTTFQKNQKDSRTAFLVQISTHLFTSNVLFVCV